MNHIGEYIENSGTDFIIVNNECCRVLFDMPYRFFVPFRDVNFFLLNTFILTFQVVPTNCLISKKQTPCKIYVRG